MTIDEPNPAARQTHDIAIRSLRVRRLQGRLAIPTIAVPLLGAAIALCQLLQGRAGALELGLLVTMYSLMMIGVIVGFHRGFSHRAFDAKQPLRAALVILGSFAGQGPMIHWVSTHRRHHAYSDAAGDPHSPHLGEDGRALAGLRGLWHAQVGWMLAGDISNAARFAKDLTHDPLLRRLSALYPVWLLLGLGVPALAAALLSGELAGAWQGVIWGGLLPMAAAQHVTWGASFAHVFGSRPFETTKGDQSRNNVLLALPLFGDGWHNNHHAFPSAAIVGFEWWQIDLGGLVIRAFAALGWIEHVKGVPPRQLRLARRRQA